MMTFPGRTFPEWSAMQAQPLWAYEGAIDPVYRHRLSVRECHLTAWLLLAGSVRLLSPSFRRRVGPGSWVIFSTRFHRQDFSAGARILSVSLTFAKAFEGMLRHPPMVIRASDHPWLETAARRMVRFAASRAPGHSHLEREPLSLSDYLVLARHTQDWLAAYLRLRSERRMPLPAGETLGDRVARGLQFLEAMPWSGGFSERRLADRLHLSPGHLERLFVAELGATPRQLWERRRREAAQLRVANEKTPLKNLAHELGFCSPAHFSNWFRKAFGSSPRAWRVREAPKR